MIEEMMINIKSFFSEMAEKYGWMFKKADVVLSVGDTLTFESHAHGSVGLWYELEYDETAFKESRSSSYVNSSFSENPCPGGDEELVTVLLTAQKEGGFLRKEIENFRGERTLKKTHIVCVNR